jgi:hypothetical protein
MAPNAAGGRNQAAHGDHVARYRITADLGTTRITNRGDFLSINKSDIVTSVSKSLRDETLKLFNITNDIEVIPNFMSSIKHCRGQYSVSSFGDCRERTCRDAHQQFQKVKRIPDVIKIFYEIQQQIPQTHDGRRWSRKGKSRTFVPGTRHP